MDYFLVHGQDQSGSRKNENLHALYAILNYAEDVYTCRRKMQLNFLGEDFDASQCNKSCDNCKGDVKVVQRDVSELAKSILNLVMDLHNNNTKFNVTCNMLIDVLRGKKVNSKVLDH